MERLKKINIPFLIFIGFLVLHAFLFDINVAEWGDSYRILRASEFVRDFSYPVNEKRPPLYSVLLALRPSFIEPIFWGRISMFIVSVLCFWVFYKLIKLLTEKKEVQNIALLLFSLNPVFLYWSIRIYADVFFTLIVLVAALVFYKQKKENNSASFLNYILLGVLAGLGVLTRFEGYILFGALLCGLVIDIPILKLNVMKILSLVKKRWLYLITYVFSFLVTISYWIIKRNPFVSSYFEESSQRSLNLEVGLIYLVSFVFLFGFSSAFYFLHQHRKSALSFLNKNVFIASFCAVELFLALLWPAAIPRLFVPIIPFACVILALAIEEAFDNSQVKNSKKQIIGSILILGFLILVFAIAQYFLKLQFLVSDRELFFALLLIQLPLSVALSFRKKVVFYVCLVASLFVWSFSVIYIHKDIYISVKHASEYAMKNLNGVVGYNDVSSVSNWYLNYSPNSENVEGRFFNYSKKEDLNYANLLALEYDYIIMTNEHNTDMTLDIESRSYLETIEEFRYIVNSKEFFSKVIKVLK